MQVSNNTYAYSINNIQSDKSSPVTAVSNSTTTKAQTDTVTISHAGRNAEEKWQDIASKYDVTNMSQSEVGKMTEELYDNKLIPKDVLIHMLAPASMNQDPDQKYDVFSQMRKSLEFAESIKTDPIQIEKKRQVIEIFERLHGLHSSGSMS